MRNAMMILVAATITTGVFAEDACFEPSFALAAGAVTEDACFEPSFVAQRVEATEACWETGPLSQTVDAIASEVNLSSMDAGVPSLISQFMAADGAASAIAMTGRYCTGFYVDTDLNIVPSATALVAPRSTPWHAQ